MCVCACACVCVCTHACMYVSSDCVSTNKIHKDLYLTEHVQNITLLIFHFYSFNPRNINSCSTNNVLYKSLQVFT
jgi:hypothetical protein